LLGPTVMPAQGGLVTITMQSTLESGMAVVTAVSAGLTGSDYIVMTTDITLSEPEDLAISGSRHSITANWTAGTNNVKYKIERKIDGGSYTTINDNYTQTTLTQDNLKAGTTYWFRVYGYNSEETLSGYVEGFFMTEPVDELKKDASGLSGTKEDKIVLSIPADTFSDDYYVQISTVSSIDTADADGKDNDIRLGVAGSARELEVRTLFGAGISGFNKEVEIEIAGIEESTLKIYVLNQEKDEWEKVGGVVNTDYKYVSANLEHFSVYCLMGEPAYAVLGIEEIANYPNPFSGETVFTFRLTKSADVKLEIYTTAGRLVKRYNEVPMDAGYNEIPESGAWDGSDLAAGVYLYKITANDSKNTITKTAKLVIMR